MGPLHRAEAEAYLQRFVDKDVYLHLETTNGAYAGNNPSGSMAVCAYIRNGRVRFERGSVTGFGPYRVGLKMDQGWIYAEGLTDWEVDDEGRLLFAGHDGDGKLAISLELSFQPFEV
ncbi:MAG: YojF family protein [Alicyclobacillaceae bacterium]|jgi:hypothetical protein|uniref:YojF family protein n=1 Tax=Alicyclobacillus sp. SP_1 TaxID=2942475 RepID=UPI0021585A8C|nr:YojF family protein [Alicyclobacillus sp. SP_1]MCY0887130.1 YojF family protein [Alicyclobacillaceae bacterium]MCY0896675.1 YojF family protein [Alicyclobacillaceae bacterium]